MKITLKKILSVIFAVCIVFTSLCISISAKTVDSVKHKSPQYGGGSATVFYVNANNKNTTKISCICSRGSLVDKNGCEEKISTGHRGYFEVLMWGRNNTSESWTKLDNHKVNIKNVTSATLSLKGYTQYKVRVYAWKTSTIGEYIGGKWDSSAYWFPMTNPTITFSAKSNVKSLAQ